MAEIPPGKVLRDIRGLYRSLGEPPSENQYDERGRYSASTVRRKFGSYTAGREEAGVPSVDRRGGQNRISRGELLDALKSLDGRVKGSPTREQMVELGKYSETPYRREFGGWTAALKAADIEPNQDPEYIEFECEFCGTEDRKLASRSTGQERYFCSQPCLHKWRSSVFTGRNHPLWNRVTVECDACGDTIPKRPSIAEHREHHFCDYTCYGQWCSEERTGESHPRWEGGVGLYYGPNWLPQRRRCLERDEYSCQECGISRERHIEQYGRDLTVHHQRPVRDFYAESGGSGEEPDWEEMNRLENLITVCIKCHHQLESEGE